MKPTIKTFLNYLSVFIIFSGAMASKTFMFAELRFFYLIIAFVMLFWLPVLKGIYLNKVLLFLFFIVIFLSGYHIFIGTSTIGYVAKQIIGIFTTGVFFYLLIKINDYNVKKLFMIYLRIAFYIAIIGLLQELCFLLGFKPGYDYSYILPTWKVTLCPGTPFLRVNSILSEPAHFCSAMIPAVFVSLVSFTETNFRFLSRWRSFIILLSYLLSLSLAGYVSMFFATILLLYNNNKLKYIIVALTTISVIFLFAYNNVKDIRRRVRDSLDVLSGKGSSMSYMNLSTFVFYNHTLIAVQSFKNNPLFGSGLGSHEITYFKYLDELIGREKVFHYLNTKDADSLFLRLLSETGLLGLFIFFVFILRFCITKSEDRYGYLWIINNAVLCMFFVKLLRNGHYFTEGFLLYIWIYYFSKIKLRSPERYNYSAGKAIGPSGMRGELEKAY